MLRLANVSGECIGMTLHRAVGADMVRRDYVSKYWPNSNTPGSQLHRMYDRIAQADAMEMDKEAESEANGHTNGEGSKTEEVKA